MNNLETQLEALKLELKNNNYILNEIKYGRLTNSHLKAYLKVSRVLDRRINLIQTQINEDIQIAA